MPVTFFLKCQRLKDLGGASAEGTFKAMLDALESYFSSDELVKIQLIVDFSNLSGALACMINLAGWDLPTMYYMNHRLEHAIKDSYEGEKSFQNVEEMLNSLYDVFKNSGKT